MLDNSVFYVYIVHTVKIVFFLMRACSLPRAQPCIWRHLQVNHFMCCKSCCDLAEPVVLLLLRQLKVLVVEDAVCSPRGPASSFGRGECQKSRDHASTYSQTAEERHESAGCTINVLIDIKKK